MINMTMMQVMSTAVKRARTVVTYRCFSRHGSGERRSARPERAAGEAEPLGLSLVADLLRTSGN